VDDGRTLKARRGAVVGHQIRKNDDSGGRKLVAKVGIGDKTKTRREVGEVNRHPW